MLQLGRGNKSWGSEETAHLGEGLSAKQPSAGKPPTSVISRHFTSHPDSDDGEDKSIQSERRPLTGNSLQMRPTRLAHCAASAWSQMKTTAQVTEITINPGLIGVQLPLN